MHSREPVPLDVRLRVLVALEEGASFSEAARKFGVSTASVSRWKDRKRRGLNLDATPPGGDRRSSRIETHHQAVVAAFGPNCDATIEEARQRLAEQGLNFGFGTLRRFLLRHAIPRNKKPRPG